MADDSALRPQGALPPDMTVERPSAVRRLAGGAWHVLAGFGFLLRRPRLWPLALLPAILASVCLVLGLLGALYSMHWIENAMVPGPERISPELGFLLTLIVWIGTLISGLVVGLAVALLLSAPVLERLSRRVDALVRGNVVEHDRGWRWELWQSVRAALYFLAATPGVLLLGLIPVVGPIIAVAWGAYALAFQLTDPALARRGLDFAERRAWHRYWKMESMGFGATGLVTLIVPVVNLLVTPALTVGGTLLVLELEDQLIPPDVSAPAPTPS